VRWDRAGIHPGLLGVATWLVPGLALARQGSPWAALPWVLTSAAVTALLLGLALSGLVWPVAVLLLLPAWLVVAPLAARPGATADPRPGAGAAVLLALLHWIPAIVVMMVFVPDWDILAADQAASLPLLAPGEVAVCRGGSPDAALTRGALVVAGDREARFLGRLLGLPGERVEPAAGTWRVDGAPAVRSVRDLLLAPGGEGSEGTRSLVYRVGDGYLSLWSRGPPEAAVDSVAPVELGHDEVYVLALDHHGGAALDSRTRGPFPLERVHEARCVLLWSGHRFARIGRPLQ